MLYNKVPDPSSDYKMAFDYAGGANVVYIGRALPGSAASAAAWQIRRLTYSGDDVTAVDFAGGTNAFSSVWDDRTTYTYS
jgi:hypothetical protein